MTAATTAVGPEVLVEPELTQWARDSRPILRAADFDLLEAVAAGEVSWGGGSWRGHSYARTTPDGDARSVTSRMRVFEYVGFVGPNPDRWNVIQAYRRSGPMALTKAGADVLARRDDLLAFEARRFSRLTVNGIDFSATQAKTLLRRFDEHKVRGGVAAIASLYDLRLCNGLSNYSTCSVGWLSPDGLLIADLLAAADGDRGRVIAYVPPTPYVTCKECGRRVEQIDGAIVDLQLQPCGHRAGYVHLCPTWSREKACQCVERLGVCDHDDRAPKTGERTTATST